VNTVEQDATWRPLSQSAAISHAIVDVVLRKLPRMRLVADDVDIGAAILQLADGTLGVLSQTRHDPLGYDIRTEMVGSRDAVTVGLGQRTPLRSLEPDAAAMSDRSWQAFFTRYETAFREELTTFLRITRGEIKSPCTARDRLHAMRIAVAAGRFPARVDRSGRWTCSEGMAP
jgi:myo-inositol 2-dehydrogenase/D-chiro-inositol 1-dehydrogenase